MSSKAYTGPLTRGKLEIRTPFSKALLFFCVQTAITFYICNKYPFTCDSSNMDQYMKFKTTSQESLFMVMCISVRYFI